MKDHHELAMEEHARRATWMQETGGYAKDMTMRDELAARAMQGMFANPCDSHNPNEETYEEYVAEIGRCAYLMADAMLAAREAK
jgi:hypothetical protein